MSEKTKSFFYAACIVLAFIVLLIIIWLVYSYQIRKLDKEESKATTAMHSPTTQKTASGIVLFKTIH